MHRLLSLGTNAVTRHLRQAPIHQPARFISKAVMFESAVQKLLEGSAQEAVSSLAEDTSTFNLMHTSIRAIAFLQMHQLQEADTLYRDTIDYLKSSMPLGQTSDSFVDIAGTYNDHAICLAQLGQYDDALARVKRALHMSKMSYRVDQHLVSCLQGNVIEILRARFVAEGSSNRQIADEALNRAKSLVLTLNNGSNRLNLEGNASLWSEKVFSSLRRASLYFTVGRTIGSLDTHKFAVEEAIVYYNSGFQQLLELAEVLPKIDTNTKQCSSEYVFLRNAIQENLFDIAHLRNNSSPSRVVRSSPRGNDNLAALMEIIKVGNGIRLDSPSNTLKATALELSTSSYFDAERCDSSNSSSIPFRSHFIGLALLDAHFHLN